MNGKVDEWIDGWEREKNEVCRPLTRDVKTGGTHAGSLVPRASGVWTTELLRAPGRCAWTRLRTTSGPEPVLPRVRAASWSTQHGVRCTSLVPSGVPTSKPFAPVPASSCDPRPACRIPVENTTARGRPPAGADRTAHARGLARPRPPHGAPRSELHRRRAPEAPGRVLRFPSARGGRCPCGDGSRGGRGRAVSWRQRPRGVPPPSWPTSRGLIWGSPPGAVPSPPSVSRRLRPPGRGPCCLPLTAAAARAPRVLGEVTSASQRRSHAHFAQLLVGDGQRRGQACGSSAAWVSFRGAA